jgi:hypothetical protein
MHRARKIFWLQPIHTVKMAKTLFLTTLAAFAQVLPVYAVPTKPNGPHPGRPGSVHPAHGICTDYTVNEEVTFLKPTFSFPPLNDNYDVASLTTNVSYKNIAGFQPVVGGTNITKAYRLAGTFCTPSKPQDEAKKNTVLLTTHGAMYDGRYWASTFRPEEYNYAQYMLEHGYSVFYYDRLGTGKSEM